MPTPTTPTAPESGREKPFPFSVSRTSIGVYVGLREDVNAVLSLIGFDMEIKGTGHRTENDALTAAARYAIPHRVPLLRADAVLRSRGRRVPSATGAPL